MSKTFFFTLTCVFFINSCFRNPKQQSPYSNAIQVQYANTITAKELQRDLYQYASDDMEGRDTGKKGQKKAVSFLKEAYEKLNIPSGINDSSYFQKVPLTRAIDKTITISINNEKFHLNKDFISINSTKSHVLSNVKLEFVNYGIVDKNIDDFKNIDVEGKIVIIKGGEPKNKDGTYVLTNSKTKSEWGTMSGYRKKFEIARKRGAIAAFYIDDPLFPIQRNRIIQKQNHEELIDLVDSEHPNFNGYLLSKKMNKALSKKRELDIFITYDCKREKIDSENVVAYIKGSKKPEEYIIITAHLDHVGMDNNKNIYNGADDDGSGTVAMLEIAEALQKAKNEGNGPERSVVFLHVTAEEKGLLGSKYYTDHSPIFPLKNTIANLNIDMIGRVDLIHKENTEYIYLIGPDAISKELHDISERANKNFIQLDLDYRYNRLDDPNRYYYRSDHHNFAKKNIPVMFYFSGVHEDYHKTTDTAEKINYDLLTKRTKLIFHTIWDLANRKD